MHVGAEEKQSWANVMAYLPIVRVQPLSLPAIPAMDGSCPCCGISWVWGGRAWILHIHVLYCTTRLCVCE
jgi:hypothetical protein